MQPYGAPSVAEQIHKLRPAVRSTVQAARRAVTAAAPEGTREIAYRGVGNDFETRIQGTRIKHRMGPTSIKAYDKAGIILHIETTTYNPKWFTHYRTVAHRDGTRSHELAPLKKSIYSLHDLRQLASAANRRYLEFLSSLEDPSVAVEAVRRASENVEQQGRTYRGFNFFSDQDVRLFEIVLRGEHTLQGLRNAHIRQHLPGKSVSQVSRMLRRLRCHGLIKKIGCTYKYYVTARVLGDDHGTQAQDPRAHPGPCARHGRMIAHQLLPRRERSRLR